MVNVSGFSPYQIVFGRNPIIRSVLESSISSLEEPNVTSIVSQHLRALEGARRAFLEAENGERVKRALRYNVRSSDAPFCYGDSVFYKRAVDKKWHGPAKIVGVDGKVTFVRHGSSLHRIHVTDLMHACESHKTLATEHNCPESDIFQQSEIVNTQVADQDNHCLHDVHELELPIVEEQSAARPDNITQDIEEYHLASENTLETCDAAYPEATDVVGLSSTPNIDNSCRQGEYEVNKASVVYPKVKSDINLRLNSVADEEFSARVISRAGKAKGKHNSWYNVEYLSPEYLRGQKASLDFRKDVAEWSERGVDEVFILDESVDFSDAKQSELKSWRDNNVFLEVDPGQPNIMSLRWVLTVKTADGVIKPKARLVCRGFTEDINKFQCESPVVTREAIKVFFTVCGAYSWIPESLDIKTAFLQCKTLDRNVFVRPPKEAATTKLWKLLKPVYGLKDASRQWYQTVRDEFCKLGFESCDFEPSLFVKREGSQVAGILCIHVDDFLIAGKSDFLRETKDSLNRAFTVGKESKCPLTFTGLSIMWNNGIEVQQKNYLDDLEEIELSSILIRTPH